MRALRKSATQYLQTVLFKDTYIQDDFEKTEVEELILDFYTAAHPYAFAVFQTYQMLPTFIIQTPSCTLFQNINIWASIIENMVANYI